MAPEPVVTEVGNQATDFAEQFMEQLMSGNVGYATPLQRDIGGAFSSLISQGPQFFDNSAGFDALREKFGLTSATGRANVAEKFSMGGSRYGTAAGTGIGRYQAQSDADMNVLMAQLASGSYESGMNRFMAMLGAGGQFGAQAMSPFTNMAGQGIVNPAVHMQENPWVTGINTGANVIAAANPFGGSAPGGDTYNTYG